MIDQDEKQVRALCEHVAEAIRTRNLDRMMSAYDADVVCFRKRGGAWKVVHEHVSVPFDRETMKPALGLAPPRS